MERVHGAAGPCSPDATRFEPPADPVYRFLLEGAADGSVPIFSVFTPLDRLEAYEPAWAPEQSPDGRRAMQRILARIGDGENLRLWVYPRGSKLIVAGDYLLYASFRLLKPPTLGVWHMLLPDPSLPASGPLPVGRVHQLIAGSVLTV